MQCILLQIMNELSRHVVCYSDSHSLAQDIIMTASTCGLTTLIVALYIVKWCGIKWQCPQHQNVKICKDTIQHANIVWLFHIVPSYHCMYSVCFPCSFWCLIQTFSVALNYYENRASSTNLNEEMIMVHKNAGSFDIETWKQESKKKCGT